MLLAQISDTHLLSLKESDPLAIKRAENLERCIETINKMTLQPAAIVHTGDMINFGPENDYDLAHEILSQLKAPFFPTVGNRDSRKDFIERFLAPNIIRTDAPFCQYRISLGDADLVCVDTKSNTRTGSTCTDRLEHIDELLSQDTSKPVFIFLHHPPTPIKALKNSLQFDSIENALALTGVFDKHDHIVRILCGHTHRSDMVKMGRHQASTLPSLATDVRLDQYPAHLADEPIFQIHELHADHHVTSMSCFADQRLNKAAE